MIVCPKCGKELADGTKFCSKCGTPLAAVNATEAKEADQTQAPKADAAQAPKAEEAPKAEAQAPKKEGAPKAEAQVPKKEEAPKAESTPAAAPAQGPKEEKEASKGVNPKLLKYIGIGVAAVVLLIILVSLFSGKKTQKPYALYVKDKEIFYNSSLKAKKSWQVTSNLIKSGSFDNEDLSDMNYRCQLTKDGKYLFFRDKIESGDDGSTIFYRDLSKPKKEAIKMDSSVLSYHINEAGTIVTYRKSGGDVWQYNVKRAEKSEKKLAKDVSSYSVSKDGSKVVYTQRNDEGQVDVYLWTKKGEEKLESDVAGLRYVSEDCGTIYYTKNDSLYKKVGLKDKEKIDSDIEKVFAIYESGEAYYAKEDEDGISEVYYYNGKESKKIAEDLMYGLEDWKCASEYAAMAYGVRTASGSDKVTYYIVVKDGVTELEQDDVASISFDKDGKVCYYVADVDSNERKGSLFKAALSKNKVGKVEKYDDDVYRSLTITKDGHVIYYKDVKDGKGELYCDKKLVDSDADVGGYEYCQATKQLIYAVDYNSNKEYATLKICKIGGKAKLIAEEVHDCTVLPDGTVLFLADYSTKSYKGSLYVYTGKKPVLLDEDVVTIIEID